MKKLFLFVLTSMLMLSVMAQSPKRVDKNLKNYHKNFFANVLGYKTNLQKFDFKPNQQKLLKSLTTAQQKMDSVVHFGWDTTVEQWENSWKDVFHYDQNGNLICDTELFYENNQWENYWKDEFTYDENGILQKMTVKAWNDSTNQWENSWKDEYTYDENGNLIRDLQSDWDSQNELWLPSWKDDYFYQNDTLIADTSTIFSNGEWQFSWESEYTYENGNLVETVDKDWSDSTNQWENSWKDEYTFDENDYLVQYVDKDWNDSTNQWENFWKDEYYYDSNGNLYIEFNKDYNSQNSSWEDHGKEEFTCNLDYSINDILMPRDYFDQFFVNRVDSITYYSYVEDQKMWKNFLMEDYFYSNLSNASVSEGYDNNFVVYPNPASKYVTFEITNQSTNAKVDIFNIEGQKIFSQLIDNNKRVDVSTFPKGIYLYRLNADGKIINGKIIKK